MRIGFSCFCERHLWKFHSDCYMPWSDGCPCCWNSCKRYCGMVRWWIWWNSARVRPPAFCLLTFNIKPLSLFRWRMCFWLSTIPAATLAIGMLLCAESPHWLYKVCYIYLNFQILVFWRPPKIPFIARLWERFKPSISQAFTRCVCVLQIYVLNSWLS